MAHELYTISGKSLTLNLHPGQAEALQSDARFTWIIAGTQSGKTSFEPFWLEREIRQRGEGDYLAVTATYDLFKLKFLPDMRRIFCGLFASQGWQESISERVIWRQRKPGMFDRIIMRSAESEGGLESATAKAAVLDEFGQDRFGLGAWEAVQRRLALHSGRVLGGTTPYNLGWAKTEVYDRWRGGDMDYRVIQFASTMNPAFPAAEMERAKRVMPDWKFQMFYLGNFTRPAGMIYGDLRDEHVIEPFPIPPEWPRYIGIDPGPVHTAVVWLAKDPVSKVVYLYDEYLEGGLVTAEHAARVKAQTGTVNIMAWALGQKSEIQYRLDWHAAGIPVRAPDIVDVEAGIDRVIELIKTGCFRVFKTCRGARDQFGTYAREIDETGKPTDKIKDKEKYHFMDALRYAVIQINGSALFG